MTETTKAKPFKALQFLRDHNKHIADPGERHYTHGWINTPCPFCSGHEGNHLGYNTLENYWHCWRCGWKSSLTVVKALLGLSTSEAVPLVHEYRGSSITLKGDPDWKAPTKVDWPTGCGDLPDPHRKYLKRRNYNPSHLSELWGIRGTGPVGMYKFRIIAPVHHGGRFVSYVGRDITDKSEKKYLPCPSRLELLPHKHTLYGLDKVPKNQETVVVVEGITDVWRLGPGAVATFGSSFTSPQLYLLSKFRSVYIIFDNEPEAQGKAETLAEALSLNAEVFLVDVPTDPADLPPDEAQDLMLATLGEDMVEEE